MKPMKELEALNKTMETIAADRWKREFDARLVELTKRVSQLEESITKPKGAKNG